MCRLPGRWRYPWVFLLDFGLEAHLVWKCFPLPARAPLRSCLQLVMMTSVWHRRHENHGTRFFAHTAAGPTRAIRSSHTYSSLASCAPANIPDKAALTSLRLKCVPAQFHVAVLRSAPLPARARAGGKIYGLHRKTSNFPRTCFARSPSSFLQPPASSYQLPSEAAVTAK